MSIRAKLLLLGGVLILLASPPGASADGLDPAVRREALLVWEKKRDSELSPRKAEILERATKVDQIKSRLDYLKGGKAAQMSNLSEEIAKVEKEFKRLNDLQDKGLVAVIAQADTLEQERRRLVQQHREPTDPPYFKGEGRLLTGRERALLAWQKKIDQHLAGSGGEIDGLSKRLSQITLEMDRLKKKSQSRPDGRGQAFRIEEAAARGRPAVAGRPEEPR